MTENIKGTSKQPVSPKQVIRQLGLKVTNQRLTILDAILKGHAHITAQEVFENVADTNPEIGFATVYRFLRTLTEQGFLVEVRMGGLPARYEWAQKEHHDHISCVKCHQICEFENEEIEKLQNKVAEMLGFQLTHHILELYGVCSECQNSATPSGRVIPSLPAKKKIRTV